MLLRDRGCRLQIEWLTCLEVLVPCDEAVPERLADAAARSVGLRAWESS
jgi:hypothetical protein